jgi:hypothetical protein
MNLLKPLGRWSARTLRALVLTAGVGATIQVAAAQMPPTARTPAAPPKLIYTKSTEFKLPIQMDDRTRANMDRVCLYVKCGNGDWVRQETGAATMPHFLYRVTQDGEYWFALTTIDKMGRMSPADVTQEPPALRVMVDTKAPVLDVSAWTSPEGEMCLRCNVVDANPNPASLKAVAKLPGGERPLMIHPSYPNVFKAGGAELQSATIVVTAADLAGNQTTREGHLRDLAPPPAPVAQVPPPVTLPAPPPATLPAPPPMPTSILTKADLPKVEPAKIEVPAPPALPSLPDSGSVMLTSATVPQPVITTIAPPAAPAMQTSLSPAPTPPRPETDNVPRTTTLPGNKQLINTTRASLDYRIDQIGPSGIGKVEVYMTADQGQTWQRLCDDPDRRSPVECDLPGEGLFGIRLAITNGNGFGGTPPRRGDAPTCWIEVDTSAPFVQLRPVETQVSNGALEIRWQATDKNLGSEPVNLFYRNRADGPWQVIARNVKNDGVYRWTFPHEASQFFVKVEVTDLAGNVARAESANPVLLDVTEPRATVLGVTGMSVRAARD